MPERRTYSSAQIGTLTNRDDRDLVERYGLMGAPFFRMEISDQSDQILFSAESQQQDGGYDLHGLIISEVTFDETDCEATSITFTVQNMDMTLHESRLFAEGNSIDLWMGYDGHTPDYMGRGIIVELEPTFDADNPPTLNVTAYDIAHFMMEEGRAEIDADGTSWMVRGGSRPAASTDSYRDEIDMGEVSNTQEEADARQDRGVGPAGAPSVDQNGPQLDLSQRPAVPVITSDDTINSPLRYTDTSFYKNEVITRDGYNQGSRGRGPLEQWRPPRRSNGKVWRDKTDSEIVEIIFHSYGIVPYIEATNERVRRGSARARVVEEYRSNLNEPPPFLSRYDYAGKRPYELQVGTNQPSIPPTGEPYVSNTREEAEERRARGEGPSGNPTPNVDDHGRELDLSQRPAYLDPVEEPEYEDQEQTIQPGRQVVQKSGTSDYEFIKKLAKNHGFIVFVFYMYDARRWIGYWGPINHVPQPHLYTFRYNAGEGTTLSSVRPRISMRNQKTEIDLQMVDPRNGRNQRVRVSMDSVSQYSPEFRGPDGTQPIREPLGNGPEVILTIHGQRVSVVADRVFTDPEDARRWLMAFWMRHASDFCTIEGTTIIGLPEMRARQKHMITGMGRLDGTYFISKTTHRMATGSPYQVSFSGYRTDSTSVTPSSEGNNLSVDDSPLGEINPTEIDTTT